MQEFSIIEALEDELDGCADVIRRSFLTVAEEFGFTEEAVPTNGAFIKTARLIAERQKGIKMFVLTENDKVIGFMQLEKAAEGTYYLEKLSVLPEFRHSGYGKALLDFAVDKVRALGGIKIGIAIIEENTKLKNWYSAYGFMHVGIKNFDNLPFTAGFMELKI